MLKRINCILCMVVLLPLISQELFSRPSNEGSSNDEVIYVSIEPLKYFVDIITGGKITTKTVVPEGTNAELYEVTPQQLFNLENSKGFFVIGLPYEQKVVNKLQEKGYTTSIVIGKNISKVAFSEYDNHDEHEEDHEEHEDEMSHEEDHDEDEHEEHEDEMSHEEDHDEDEHDDHDHGEYDPHIWVSVRNAPVIATEIFEALSTWYPEMKDEFSQGYQALLAEIDVLQEFANNELSPHTGKGVLMYHPVLTYLAQEFGFIQYSLQWKGQERSVKQVREIINNTDNIFLMFIQEGFPKERVVALSKQFQIPIVQITPLNQNWNNTMYTIIKELSQAFETSK